MGSLNYKYDLVFWESDMYATFKWPFFWKTVLFIDLFLALGLRNRCGLDRNWVLHLPICAMIKYFMVNEMAEHFCLKVSGTFWRWKICGFSRKGGRIIAWNFQNMNSEDLQQKIFAVRTAYCDKIWAKRNTLADVWTAFRFLNEALSFGGFAFWNAQTGRLSYSGKKNNPYRLCFLRPI